MSRVRELATKFLDSAGYNVLAAKDGVEAIEIANGLRQPIGGLLTDVVMPRMRGTELAARLSDALPEMKVIFMSGYLENNEECIRLSRKGLFSKSHLRGRAS